MTEITLSTGRTLKLRPVGIMLMPRIRQAVERELRDRGLPLDPPTYSVTTAAGTVETHPHDDESVQTDEERAALTAHKEAVKQLEYEVALRSAKALLCLGVEDVEVPQEWIETRRWLGVEVPDDPRDLKVEYLQEEVLARPSDLWAVLGKVQEISLGHVSEEAATAARELFRGQVAGHEPGESASRDE